MRKLKLDADDLVVETFEAVEEKDVDRGTVHAEQETNDPRQRRCVTPYVECATYGWTCDYCTDPFTCDPACFS